MILMWISVFAAIGCTSLSPQTSPEDSLTGRTKTHIPKTPDTDLSAAYYYLESRIHIKNRKYNKAIESLEKALAKDPDSFILVQNLIQLHVKTGDEAKAIALVENLAQNHPDNVDGLLMLIQLKKDTIEEKKLISILNRILILDPKNKSTFLRLGKIYLDTEDDAQAKDLFNKMVEQFPDYYVAWYYQGQIYMKEKKYALAEKSFLKSIELEPDLIEPRLQLIHIYGIKNSKPDKQKIIDIYNDILKIEPENYQARLGKALYYYKNNQTKKADKAFAALAQHVDSDSRLIMTAFDEYISEKKSNDAVIIFTQLLKSDPDNATLNFFTAMAYESVENSEKAISHYSKIPPDHSQYKSSLLKIAYLYRDLKQNRKATVFLEGKHRQHPEDIDITAYLASFYESDSHYEKAIDLLEKSLVDHPENTSLLFKLGAVLDKAGYKDQSLDTMNKILQIDPQDASALNYIGYTYADSGIKLDEALVMLQKANEIRPDDGYIIDSLGWAHFKRGEYDKAIEYLERAAELTSYETIIAEHLGDAYLKADMPDKAIKAYEKSISNATPEDTEKAREVTKKLEAIKNTK